MLTVKTDSGSHYALVSCLVKAIAFESGSILCQAWNNCSKKGEGAVSIQFQEDQLLCRVYLHFLSLSFCGYQTRLNYLFPQEKSRKRLPEEEGGDTQATYAYFAAEAGAKAQGKEAIGQVLECCFTQSLELHLPHL